MENQFKILIADETQETKAKLVEELSNDNRFKVVEALSGTDLVLKAQLENPDFIVMDILLSGKDGFTVIEQLRQSGVKSKVIVTTCLISDTFVSKAMSMGVYYYMIKPYEAKVLKSRIIELTSPVIDNTNNEIKEYKNNQLFKVPSVAYNPENKMKYIEEKITNIFITVGIPAHIKGYQFLREAILMAIDNPEVINSITKQLYPTIAIKFETTSSKVERAIRHAIEVAWNRGKIENINTVFGIKVYSSNEKPTNGEFIALVADKMLLEG